MDIRTITDRKSEYYRYVASTWGTSHAEFCRTMTLIEDMQLGETLFRKANSRDNYGFYFPDIDGTAIALAQGMGLNDPRIDESAPRCAIVSQGRRYYLLNPEVQYSDGGHQVEYKGQFVLVLDPS